MILRKNSLRINLSRLVLMALFLTPIYLMIVSAFRPDLEMYRYGGKLSLYTLLPHTPIIDNILEVLQRPYFLRQIANTLVLGVVQSTLTVILGVLAAFPLARMKFFGRDAIFFSLLATIFVPFEVIVVPLFMVVRSLAMLDSYQALLIPWIASPVAIYILRNSMQEIPVELDEAAIIDGANLWQILKTVVVPNVWPAMTTVWLLTFMYLWDSFLWPLVVVSDPSKQLVQIGISNLFNPERVRYGLVFAASLVAIFPVALVFIVFQRKYQRSMVLSGIK